MSAQAPGGKSWAAAEPVGDWALLAACRAAGVNPDWWFPTTLRARERWTSDAQRAVRICAGCDVREQCLSYALRTDEQDGIWGAKLPAERRELAKRPASERVSCDDPLGDFAIHGTEAGYKRHRRANQDPCERCREGMRIASRERKARRQRAQLRMAL